MSKVANYLQEHLLGEVMTSVDAKNYFSTDNSIFTIQPSMIVYPRNESDIRKTARFTWQLAERGRVIPITARGAGTDQTGAAIGNGIILVFSAHMNKILEFDSKSGLAIIEPGINFSKLQETLHTHGRFLPSMPSSGEYSTLGGAVANNSSGSDLIKYGELRGYIQGLRVILANGEVIETARINKKELNKKLGLTTFEGEIYRQIDTLIEEEISIINQSKLNIIKNNAGFDLMDIKRKDGSFDLTPLFVGSQGTLGIISEITLSTENYNPETNLLMATCDNIDQIQSIVNELNQLSELPSAIEIIDGNLLREAYSINSSVFKGLIESPFPAFCLFIELDIVSDRILKKTTKKIKKILEKNSINVSVEYELANQQKMWKLRDISSYLLSHNYGTSKALPVIGDGVVPYSKVNELLVGVYKIFERTKLTPAIWGHIGSGMVHLQPRLDVNQVGDRQKIFKLMDEYYALILSLGGSISGEGNDGRLRAPYLASMYSTELMTVFEKVKIIFDPYGTLNPGVKFGTSIEDLKQILRQGYSLNHIYNYLPRN